MKEVRNLAGKKVCLLGNKKIEIVFKGMITIIDFKDPEHPKIINKKKQDI